MNTRDILGTAVSNTFRSKARTTLTVLAIFVGAFSLSATSALGAGINAYIDDTVSAMGVSNVMTVTRLADGATGSRADDGPRVYDPDAIEQVEGPRGLGSSPSVVMTDADIAALAEFDGITDVQATKSVVVDYVTTDDSDRFEASVGSFIPGQTLQLDAGAAPDNDSSRHEIAIPVDYVDTLGFADSDEAVDALLQVTVTDAAGTQHTFEPQITGVSEATIGGPGGSQLTPNTALMDALYEAQSIGLADDEMNRWDSASVWVDSPDDIASVQDELADAGFNAVTVEDQLGVFTSVIDTIILVLNGFAVIALLAAGFGIVNTLLMSVQERTREIGLMKAVGMSSGRVFALFSTEAAFIGLLGSVVGVLGAVVAGRVVSRRLADSFLADLPGLDLFVFTPATVATVVAGIMLLAFLAGTIPAARAARKDPVDALRYE